ncbi:sunset domain-containing protein [Sporosarcina aquimarina]|uniref:Uncharacterized protein n=1 Tax=Sporosarcina aquimarina TaxID=114975 RepID=A0ABU4G198_9BACL|nr:hypothetical protein [Sporosarcina aquimarina]MDW0110718.1 hypothetical protein [Sporosarcina aquimarina]
MTLLIVCRYFLKRKAIRVKAISLSLSVFALAALVSGCGAEDTSNQQNLEMSSKTSTLIEDNKELKSELLAIESELQEVQKVSNGQAKELKLVKEDIRSKEKEISGFNATIETLKNKTDTLMATVTEKDVVINKMNEQSASAASSSASDSTSTSTTSPSTQTSAQNSSSSSSQTDCDIKGSNSGIYHTPGSTYYNRTTNVARWFCSAEEAEAAGYRAPKR